MREKKSNEGCFSIVRCYQLSSISDDLSSQSILFLLPINGCMNTEPLQSDLFKSLQTTKADLVAANNNSMDVNRMKKLGL
jgi:hypothetical protein